MVEEASAIDGVAGRQQFGVGKACVVVDRDVQVLPADPAVAVWPAGLGAERPLAWLPEAAELLTVDVEQLAGPLAFVAARTP